MPKFSRGKKLKNWNSNQPEARPGKLRIVGGKFRGRQIDYLGDPRTRPMKDNIREALFNLVGGWVPDKAIIDLFAGTGAVGLEAISRGAASATLIERHIPTAKIIQQNVRTLDSALPVTVESMDTFFWGRQFLADKSSHPQKPWMVFCCAPYALYIDRVDDILGLIDGLIKAAPDGSLFVVESDSRFEPKQLPQHELWSVREYQPAQIAVLKLGFKPDDSALTHG